MKHVVFKKLKIRNFMSIGETPVEIDFKPGVNIITGTNKDKTDRRNGAGKSSIADAIFFAMYGNILRPVKKEAIKNDVTNGTCEVTLELDVVSEIHTQKLLIVRSLGPSRLELYIDGIEKTLDSIASTTDYIIKLIGCNPEVFENCIVMTLNSALPFMCRKKHEKRQFIEGIFNLEVFSRMLKEAKDGYSSCKSKLEVAAGRAEEIEISIRTIKNQLTTFNTTKASKLEKLNKKLTNLADDVLDLDKDLNKNIGITEQDVKNAKNFLEVEFVTKEKDYRDKAKSISDELSKYQALLGAAAEAIKKMDANADSCPVCLRHITDEDRKHVDEERAATEQRRGDYRIKILDLKQRQNEHSMEWLAISKQKNAASELIDKWETREGDKQEIQRKIDSAKKEADNIAGQILETEKEQAPFDDLTNTQQAKLDEVKTQKQEYTDRLNLLNQVKFVFSEEGVKSLIVKRTLNIFNTQLAYYLQQLDANCSCTFNEYFEESIINDKGKEYSYFSLSGAERKSIDLACLFTFMDIRRLQGDVAFNISVFDELFDSSLDAKSVDLVLEVLKERVEKFNECVYVISHRKESTRLATGEVIYLVKNNGITTRVDFVDMPHQ
jgi:DNA repair exonuclease SbcCD ATPase subunit